MPWLTDRGKMMNAQELEVVTGRFYAAVNQLQQGDPAPMFALWSHRADVLNLGPQGGRQQGWEQVRAHFAHAADLAAAKRGVVRASVRDVLTTIAGEIAYVAAAEEVQVNGAGHVLRFTARATNIDRWETDNWKLVYRLADAPPVMVPASQQA